MKKSYKCLQDESFFLDKVQYNPSLSYFFIHPKSPPNLFLVGALNINVNLLPEFSRRRIKILVGGFRKLTKSKQIIFIIISRRYEGLQDEN